MNDYEIIEHTADIGIRAFGDTQKSLFENAAAGMFSLICDPSLVRDAVAFPVSLEAEDRETLLVEWLNELLFLFEARSIIFGRFEVDRISEVRLTATAYGESLDRERHRLMADIKAVTYHMLRVIRTDGRWEATVIFDV
ncbi:hypothetical protein BMS3Abin01_00692 [bacterium BMS3Abin01]|nr:hypothetical protein BMS3Abin01_00692 [bacterium BMS3Abin01]